MALVLLALPGYAATWSSLDKEAMLTAMLLQAVGDRLDSALIPGVVSGFRVELDSVIPYLPCPEMGESR